jgi:3-isopropylmalate/(R)-2-methylmalate dehydratase small subunit
VSIDVSSGKVTNLTSGKIYQAEPLPEFIQKIARAGGLINFVKGEA